MVILQQRAAGSRANSGSSIAPELYVEGASRAGIFQSTAAKTRSLARSALVQGDGHGKDTAPTTQGRLPGWHSSMLSLRRSRPCTTRNAIPPVVHLAGQIAYS